jgi:diaminohydroxyphosphoribosylaminopyrimidine deaminase/5-amino-6-(5-phosphoribosylamino)uracil reductase
VLTGIGTLLEDDPRLDVRLVETARQPLRVVVDSRLETPPTAKLLAPPGEVLVYGAVPNAEREAALRATGAEVAFFPERERGKVDLAAMLADLAARGVNELHVEAGHKLNASLLQAGLVDELLVYLAPKLIGLGREMAAFGPLETLADAMELEFREVEAVGRDLRILARPPRRGDF